MHDGEGMQSHTDEQLMELLRAGQTGALDELYARYARRLFVFCHHLTGRRDSQAAEDLVQNAFLRVIRAAGTFNPEQAACCTWLFTIARNLCLDHLRRLRNQRSIPLEGVPGNDTRAERLPLSETLAADAPEPETGTIQAETAAAVRDCLRQLEVDEEREAILLYYLGEMVLREIAVILEKSISTVKNRLEAAKAKLRRCLQRKGIETAAG